MTNNPVDFLNHLVLAQFCCGDGCVILNLFNHRGTEYIATIVLNCPDAVSLENIQTHIYNFAELQVYGKISMFLNQEILSVNLTSKYLVLRFSAGCIKIKRLHHGDIEIANREKELVL